MSNIQETKHHSQSKNFSNKRKSLPQRLRDNVWRNQHGSCKDGWCYTCGKELTDLSFECGHIVAAHHGGPDTEDNLKPLCSSCNKSMGAQNLYEFMSYFSYISPEDKVSYLKVICDDSRLDQKNRDAVLKSLASNRIVFDKVRELYMQFRKKVLIIKYDSVNNFYKFKCDNIKITIGERSTSCCIL